MFSSNRLIHTVLKFFTVFIVVFVALGAFAAPFGGVLDDTHAAVRLGSLVLIGGQQHILSNYHVFESDIVAGGNNTVATTGDSIIQPGLIDVNCSVNGAQSVATLVKKSSLPSSNVDCSVGKVVSGQVRTDGS